MRMLLVCIAVLFPAMVFAQSPPAPSPPSPDTLDRIRTALSSPPALDMQTPLWEPTETPHQFGIFTFKTPDSGGEALRLSVPIGELVTRAIRSVKAAQYHRAERKAREEVADVVQQLDALAPQK
ncbi:MAG TPA: hypothetical protein VGG73_13815 [Vicinamibacterales bacterium]|jgi:hypothetical protein